MRRRGTIGVGFGARQQLHELRHADIVDDQGAIGLVDRGAAPVHAAIVAGILQRAGEAGRRELALIAQLLEADAAIELVEGGRTPHTGLGEGLVTDRGHADRIGLRRRQEVLLGAAILWHRLFLDLGDRLAVAAVQHEDLAALGHLDQRRHLAALAVRNVIERRLRGKVIVPQIVMHGLELPAFAAGGDVERHDRGSVVFRRLAAFGAEEVGRSVAGRQIDKAERVIIARRRPDIGRAARVALTIGRQLGDGGIAEVPGPDQFASPGAEGPDGAGRFAGLDIVPDPAADHDEIAHDGGSRRLEVEAGLDLAHALLEIDSTALAEILAGLAGPGVDLDQPGVDGGHDDAAGARCRYRGGRCRCGAVGGRCRRCCNGLIVAHATAALP